MARGKERQQAEETQDSGSLRVGFLQKLWCRRTPHLRRGEQCQAAAPRSWENTWGRGSRGPNRRPLRPPTLCLCSTWAAWPICGQCKPGLPMIQEGRVQRPIWTSTGAHHKRHRVDRGVAGDWRHRLDMVQNRRQWKRHVPVSTATVSQKSFGRCSARLRTVLIKSSVVVGKNEVAGGGGI